MQGTDKRIQRKKETVIIERLFSVDYVRKEKSKENLFKKRFSSFINFLQLCSLN